MRGSEGEEEEGEGEKGEGREEGGETLMVVQDQGGRPVSYIWGTQ